MVSLAAIVALTCAWQLAAQDLKLRGSRALTTCSASGEDCRSTRCCSNSDLTCFEKDERWAGCKANCTPGIDQNDEIQYRTSWSCKNLMQNLETTTPSVASTSSSAVTVATESLVNSDALASAPCSVKAVSQPSSSPAFVWGERLTNQCMPGFRKIKTAGECQLAVEAMSKNMWTQYDGEGWWFDFPSGCSCRQPDFDYPASRWSCSFNYGGNAIKTGWRPICYGPEPSQVGFFWGRQGWNDCSEGLKKIGGPMSCEKAVLEKGARWKGVWSAKDYPKGCTCYWDGDHGTGRRGYSCWFNWVEGRAKDRYAPLCYGLDPHWSPQVPEGPHIDLSDANANTCNPGYRKIRKNAECERAAEKAAGDYRFEWGGAGWWFDMPSGCVCDRSKEAHGRKAGLHKCWLNHGGNAKHAAMQPVCYGPEPAQVGFYWGQQGSNNCPTGMSKIGGPTSCQEAVEELGATWKQVSDANDYPKGCSCYWDGDTGYGRKGYSCWFNSLEGRAKDRYAPICYGQP